MPMPTFYDSELAALPHIYKLARHCDINKLKDVIAGSSEASVIGVGSGGSFTVASLLCNLHETYTGRVSRPATPLEIICNPTLAESSPVFLFSAEGKNPDITEALIRARNRSARAIHVLTNRSECPLIDLAHSMSEVTAHVFELTQKDGYLATTSLLFNAVLLARAYAELDQAKQGLPIDFSHFSIGSSSLKEWLVAAMPFAQSAAARGSLTIIYSPLLKPIATDLESKLSEAALLHVQLADIRSYAHGRHLWLASRPNECALLAITEPSLGQLWSQMKTLVPATVPTLAMELRDASPTNLIAGLAAEMHLVSVIGKSLGKDPGKQEVPQFGRDLYYANLAEIIPAPTTSITEIDSSKYEVLGSSWPSARNHEVMTRARNVFIETMEKQMFRAVVFDYDGTLCSSRRRDFSPPVTIIEHLKKLIRSGITVGIASGRGGSIQECMAKVFPSDLLDKLQLGLYNGGWIQNASKGPISGQETSEFLSHVTRIIVRLKSLGVPITDYKANHPYQVSVRFREGLQTDNMWFVVADALRQAGLDLSSMVRSKHSVDILASGVNKARLIAHIVQSFNIDPYQVLTLGDQGAWPGNDSNLLEHKFSLSVDMPSRRLDRGWKLAPQHKRGVEATGWYLDRFQLTPDSAFNIKLGT